MKSCSEYLVEKLGKSGSEEVNELLREKNWVWKQGVKEGQRFVWIQGLHIGFGVLKEFGDFETDECVDGKVVSRMLPLFHDGVQVVKILEKK